MNFVDGVFLRFSAVGLGNTLVGLFVIYSLKIIGFGDVLSNVVGYIFGLILSFILNKKWAFKCTKSNYSTFFKFLLVIVIAYLANLGTVMYLIENHKVNSFLSQFVGIPIYAVISYIGCRLFVFNTVSTT